MFQEGQGIFCRKTQRTRQLKRKLPKTEKNYQSSGQKAGKATPNSTIKMDEHNMIRYHWMTRGGYQSK